MRGCRDQQGKISNMCFEKGSRSKIKHLLWEAKTAAPVSMGGTQEQRLQEAAQRLTWHSPSTAVTPELAAATGLSSTQEHQRCTALADLWRIPEGFVSAQD